ncbi:CMGC/MAPK/P38 protein kinase [Helicocarpus griseus UAMH5409]|uniref:CMGC/MAPK/P38 protein kinase n=1 Tax=Helicocarpus griseus UAMH5409 TaxID=1447875 RepID=A0A2B7XAP9_9EURO|nr:CMGC/MAPK/P38 protein kinase [Helicocarpus griseus UAMH5409]
MLEFLYMQQLLCNSFEVAPSSATDVLLNNQVAIKKIHRPFKRSELCQRAYLELKLLKLLRHENVSALQDVFVSFGENVYLITQYQGMTLEQYFASTQLEERFTKVLFYQLLRGLKYLHSANIVHCDVKPSSILITESYDLQLTGLDNSHVAGQPVTDDWLYGNGNQCYQAPELMVGMPTYQSGIDMWAAGCIFAEMINGGPLFSEKRSTNQLYAIIRILGYLPDDLFNGLGSGNVMKYLKSLPVSERTSLRTHIKTADLEALELIEHLLDFDPETRYPADKALEHAYVSLYHDATDEPTSEKMWSVDDLDYVEWPVNDWKNLMYVTRIQHGTHIPIAPYLPPDSSGHCLADSMGRRAGTETMQRRMDC